LKRGAVFPVPIMDEILPGRQATPLFHGHIAGHLDHPCLIGMRRHARNMHLPTAQMDEKEHVVRHQSPQGPDLGGEEAGGPQPIHMRADELFPRGGGLALWRWWDAVALGILPTVWSLMVYPRLARAPTMRS